MKKKKREENYQLEMLEGAKLIGAEAATIASAGATIDIGNVLSSLIHFVARNPSLAKQSFGYAILGFALTEAIASFAPMMAFLISSVFRSKNQRKKGVQFLNRRMAIKRKRFKFKKKESNCLFGHTVPLGDQVDEPCDGKPSRTVRKALNYNERFTTTSLHARGARSIRRLIGWYTWSPDAIEGPTLVFALIYAATMVTSSGFMIERIKNPPGGLPSYKSYETGAGFSKKPRSWVAKRAYLETWDLIKKCEGNTQTLGTEAWLSFVCGRRSGKVCPSTAECFDLRYSIKFIETESCLNWINIQPIPCNFISLLLLVGHCDRKECPVYYLSRVITGLGTGYSVVEGHCLTLVFVTQKLRRAARRFLTLVGYDMKCVTPNAMKSKALVDLLAHFPCGEYEYAPLAELSAAVLEEANKFQKTCLQCKFYPCPVECALEHYIMKTGESPI
nr:ATPase subunit 9, mitochondrial [Tanacetum cinerariifolium]